MMDRSPSLPAMAAFGILAASAALSPPLAGAHPVRWTHRSSATGDLPVPPPSNGQAGLRVLDVDRDGRNDYILTLWDASAIVWYRRVGSTFRKYTIEPRSINLTHGERFADIDGDGDIDLIFGQWSLGNDIYWWENPHPIHSPETPWVRHLVRDEGGNFYHHNIWGDFDGDGIEEFAAWNQGGCRLLLFEVPPNPRTSGPWPATAIFAWSAESGTSFRGIAAADVNLDGKIDLIGGGGWFEHLGGDRFVFHEIDPAMRTARQVAGQVIAGCPPEIVAVQELAAGPIRLYVLSGSQWRARTLIDRVPRSHTLELGDIDGDGHLDILHGEMGPLDYYGDPPPSDPTLRVLYGDGAGGFIADVVHVGQGTLEAKLADMDGDGDLDIVGNTFRRNAPRIDIWINEGSGPPGGNACHRSMRDRIAGSSCPRRHPWRARRATTDCPIPPAPCRSAGASRAVPARSSSRIPHRPGRRRPSRSPARTSCGFRRATEPSRRATR